MPSDRASQTIRRRRLAAELRRLRERADLTGDQAAELLGWSGSKISRIETHRIGVKPADLRKLFDLYRVDPAHREQIQALLREAAGSSWLESVTAGFPADYATIFTRRLRPTPCGSGIQLLPRALSRQTLTPGPC